MSDLDLSAFFEEPTTISVAADGTIKNGDLSNLDWLDITEEQAEEMSRLPMPNTDISPELEQAWMHTDTVTNRLVPNTGAAERPKSVLDTVRPDQVISRLTRTARLAVMQTQDTNHIKEILTRQFDADMLRMGRTALAGVLAERGLLGRVYIAASDFPECAKGKSDTLSFVRKYASEAKYLISKEACGTCTHRQGVRCSLFHKELVRSVPYSDVMASEIENRQITRGRDVQANANASPVDRIRTANLAPKLNTRPDFTGQHHALPKPIRVEGSIDDNLIAVGNLTKKRDAAAQLKVAEAKARPVVEMLRREMLKGYSPDEVVKSMRLAFDSETLKNTQVFWEPHFKQLGLYGVVYSSQDSFADCHEGANFLAKRASTIRAIVAGAKCDTCIYNKIGRCMMYGRKLVREASEVLTPEVVAQVVDEHRIAGRLPDSAKRVKWGSTPIEALKAIHKASTTVESSYRMGSGVVESRANIEQALEWAPREYVTSPTTKREIVKTARVYLNEGLYGEDLGEALRKQFEVRDIRAAFQEVKPYLAEQGLQGIKFIDPTVYDDYGRGCSTAAAKHRSRAAVKYAKIGSKCSTCVHHTRPGFCSVLAKQLVVEPPYHDKAGEQRAMLATGRASHVSYADLINNGANTLAEFQIQNPSLPEFEIVADNEEVEIQMGGHGEDFKVSL